MSRDAVHRSAITAVRDALPPLLVSCDVRIRLAGMLNQEAV